MPEYSPVLSRSTVVNAQYALLVFPRVLLLMPKYFPVLSRSTVANAQDTLHFFPGVLLLMTRMLSWSFPDYCC